MSFFVDRFGIKQGFIHEIGKRIRALREELGMSQLELAEKISVSENDIKLWEETSKNQPSSQNICKIANALNSTYAYLVQGFDEDYVKNRYGKDIFKKAIRCILEKRNVTCDILEKELSINYLCADIIIRYLVKNKYVINKNSDEFEILIDERMFEEIFKEKL